MKEKKEEEIKSSSTSLFIMIIFYDDVITSFCAVYIIGIMFFLFLSFSSL